VLLLVLLVHLPALGGELVYDDLLLVARNPLIVGFDNVPTMFSKPYFEFLDPQSAARIGYWRPLTALAMSVAHQLGDGAPSVFHAASILLHVAACGVLFRLLLRLDLGPHGAGAATLLFGVHPVHVESVAWISALGDPLFGLLAVLSADRFLAWRERGSAGFPLAAAACFGVALLAKELALATVALVLVLDFARAGRPRELVRAYGPFLLAFLGYWVARAFVFGDAGAGFGRTTTELEVGLGRGALLGIELLGGSLALLLWPRDLALFHAARPAIPLGDAAFSVQVLLLVAFVLAVVLLARRRERLGVAALLLVPTGLLPVLARLRSLGPFPLSERYLYLSVLGVALGFVLLAERFLPPRRGLAAAAVAALALGARTVVRIADWKDEPSLFASAARVEPHSPYVQWGLGRALVARYRSSGGEPDLLEADRAFRTAEELVRRSRGGDRTIHATDHDFVQARLGQAWVRLLLADGVEEPDLETPRRLFETVTLDHPENADAFVGLGAACFRAGDLAAAERAFQRAVELEPWNADAHFNLARVHEELDQLELAVEHYTVAHEHRPRRPAEVLALARISASTGAADARAWIELARELAPAEPEVALIAGVLAANEGRLDQARIAFDAALALDGDYGPAFLQRGKLFASQERGDEALADFERAAALLPERFEAQYNLGAFLSSRGEIERAREILLRAYALPRSAGPLEALRLAYAYFFQRDPGGLLALARADLARGDPAGGAAWLEAVRSARPNWLDLHLTEARFLFVERPADALDLLRRLERAHPEDGERIRALEAELRR